jgi:hypothetical protein
MLGSDGPPDREIAADLVAGEDRLELLADLVGGAEPGLRAPQPPLEVGQVIEGGGEPVVSENSSRAQAARW